MTPIERRAGQPVPETEDQAAERFRCEGLLAIISGRQCALMHAQARKTGDQFHRHVCVDCPAGMARAALMGIGEPLCSALVGGKPCGRETAPRSRFCQKHKCAGAHMHQRMNERPVFAEGGEIQRAPRREMPPPIEPRACPSCQYIHTPRASIPVEVADWCVGCRCRAKAALQRRHRPTDAAHVARLLSDPEFYEKVMAEDVVEKRKPGRRERLPRARKSVPVPPADCRRCRRPLPTSGQGCKAAPQVSGWCKTCRLTASNAIRASGGAVSPEGIAAWLSEREGQELRHEQRPPAAVCRICLTALTNRRGALQGEVCAVCAGPAGLWFRRRGIKPTPEQLLERALQTQFRGGLSPARRQRAEEGAA